MAVGHGRTAALYVDERNLTLYARQAKADASGDVLDTTVFGSSVRTKTIGLKHGVLSGECFFDPATDASFDALKDAYGNATPAIVSFFPQGDSLGSRAVLMYAHEVSFETSAVSDSLIMGTYNLEAAEDAIDYGVSLHALGADTSSTNGTGVDNTNSSANGGVAYLHVTATAGAAPSTVIKVQHSTNNSTWVDLVTFTAATAAGMQRSEVAAGTTVNRYLRAISTLGASTTSITFNASFARR